MTIAAGEGNGTPLQYSCLENPMDGGAWKAAVHGVAEGRTWLSDFTFTFHFHALEKEMATRSSVLAWRVPGTGEPGGLPFMGSHRVGHDWSDLAAAAAVLAQKVVFLFSFIFSKKCFMDSDNFSLEPVCNSILNIYIPGAFKYLHKCHETTIIYPVKTQFIRLLLLALFCQLSS